MGDVPPRRPASVKFQPKLRSCGLSTLRTIEASDKQYFGPSRLRNVERSPMTLYQISSVNSIYDTFSKITFLQKYLTLHREYTQRGIKIVSRERCGCGIKKKKRQELRYLCSQLIISILVKDQLSPSIIYCQIARHARAHMNCWTNV